MYSRSTIRNPGRKSPHHFFLLNRDRKGNTLHPVLSVIVPAYNEERHLTACLSSILNQDLDLPYEVILVDGPSDDGTPDIAERFPVRLIRLEQRGIGAAWKAGAECSRSELLAFTEADTVVPVHWLSTIHRMMKENPQAVGMVGSFALEGKHPAVNALAGTSIYLTDKLHEFLTGTVAFRGKNFAIRSHPLADSGGFDAQVEAYGDVELSMRVKKLGRILYVPSLVVQTSSREFEGLKRIAGFLRRAFTALYLINVGRGNQVKIPASRRPKRPSIRTDEGRTL
jgi:glycosyltransferase involved in cell wall biosynthesis